MKVTDEQIIEAFIRTGSVLDTATELGKHKSNVSVTLKRMRLAGVKLPGLKRGTSYGKYPPHRVAELNEYIEQLQTGKK